MKNLIPVIIFITLLFPGHTARSANNNKELFEQGKEAFNSGNFGSSDLLFRKILDSDDEEYKDEAHFLLAKSIFYQKKFKSAIFEFNSYLTKCRTTGLCIESRYWIGESHYFLKNYNSAIEEYKRYIANSKNNKIISASRDRIGTIYSSQKRYDEAIIEWEKAIKICRDKDLNAERVFNIGKALFINMKYRKSLKKLNPLLTSKSDKKIIARARIILGRNYQALNNDRKALLMFKGIPSDLVKEHPYSEAQYYKALSYINLKKINSAIPLLELFIIIGKKSDLYYNAYLDLSKIYIEMKKEGSSIKLLEEVRKKSGNEHLRVKASIYLSSIYLNESPEKAIPYLEEAAAINVPEEHKNILLLLGKAYMDAGKYDESEKVFDEFIRKYPFDKNREEVDFLRARIYLEKGETGKAIEQFETFQRENPFSKYLGESNYYLALVNYKKSRYKKAVDLLRKYLARRDSENAYRAKLLLVDCFLNLKDMKNARWYAERLIRQDLKKPDVEKTIFSFAHTLYMQGKNADRYFRIIVRTFPNSNERYMIALIFGNRSYGKKEYLDAILHYTTYLKGPLSKEKGVAYFNTLLSYYKLEQYENVVNAIRSGKRPPLDESQWEEIPLLLNRSLFKMKKYQQVYEGLYTDDFSIYSKEDLLLFIISAIESDDLEIASRAAQVLSSQKELYSQALYHFGNYHLTKKEYDRASGMFSRIIIECPGTSREESAKLQLASIYINNKRYTDAIKRLTDIKNGEHRNQKNSLLIISYIKDKRVKDALKLVSREWRRLLRSEYGEAAMAALVEYFFEKGDIKQFNKFSAFLKRYKGNEIKINFMSARLYYKRKNFRRSFYFYYKLSLSQNIYTYESFYYLGRISLFVDRNRNSAKKYFQKLLDNQKDRTDLYYDTLINMAIISNEENRPDESKKYLDEVLLNRENRIAYNRAVNLYTRFGYKREAPDQRKDDQE
jgi:tetratricopeptide (TPR) repeat protein